MYDKFRQIKEETLPLDQINRKARKLYDICESSNRAEDHFLYAYFCYRNKKIENNVVKKSHWLFFRQGWVAIPFLMSVIDDENSSARSKTQMFRYLFAFVVPEKMRKEIFSKEELLFLDDKYKTPEFLVKEIKRLILKIKENPLLADVIKKYMLKLLACIRKEKEENLEFEGYDPSRSFKGYELPEQF